MSWQLMAAKIMAAPAITRRSATSRSSGSIAIAKRRRSQAVAVLRVERGRAKNAADVSAQRAFALACAARRLYQASRL